MVVYSCLEVLFQKLGQLCIATVGNGRQSATIVGITKMLLWFVDS